MKRLLSLFLSICTAFTSLAFICSAEAAENLALKLQINNPVMIVNSTEIDIDDNAATPVIADGRTLVPIRAVIEAMGGTAEWNNETKTAVLKYGDDEIRLIIDSTTAYFNNESVVIDTAPAIINGRTMLPIRFIAESFKFDVNWNNNEKIITIEKNTTEDDKPQTKPLQQMSLYNAGFDLEKGTVMLNSGYEMPILGIGTFRLTPEQAENSVYNALKDGYRLIDTANAYMDERAVGRAIKRAIDEGIVTREDVFVTTKLWVSEYERTEESIDETLARLDLDYIDLILLHQPYGNYIEGYKGLEKAVEQGKVRSIGISNFYEKKFDKIMEIANIPPAVLQNESHPYFHDIVMKEYIAKYGTILEAWYPLGGGDTSTQSELFSDETILEIGKKYGKTAPQIILRWHLQVGTIAIPGSTNPDHIAENWDIFDFELTDEDMERLNALNKGERSYTVSEEEAEKNFTSRTWDFDDQE